MALGCIVILAWYFSQTTTDMSIVGSDRSKNFLVMQVIKIVSLYHCVDCYVQTLVSLPHVYNLSSTLPPLYLFLIGLTQQLSETLIPLCPLF